MIWFDCDCALVLPFWSKEVVNLFSILQELTVESRWNFREVLGFYRDFGHFKEMMDSLEIL